MNTIGGGFLRDGSAPSGPGLTLKRRPGRSRYLSSEQALAAARSSMQRPRRLSPSRTQQHQRPSSPPCILCGFLANGRHSGINRGKAAPASTSALNAAGHLERHALGKVQSTGQLRSAHLHKHCLDSLTKLGCTRGPEGQVSGMLTAVKAARSMSCAHCHGAGACVDASGVPVGKDTQGRVFHVPCAVEAAKAPTAPLPGTDAAAAADARRRQALRAAEHNTASKSIKDLQARALIRRRKRAEAERQRANESAITQWMEAAGDLLEDCSVQSSLAALREVLAPLAPQRVSAVLRAVRPRLDEWRCGMGDILHAGSGLASMERMHLVTLQRSLGQELPKEDAPEHQAALLLPPALEAPPSGHPDFLRQPRAALPSSMCDTIQKVCTQVLLSLRAAYVASTDRQAVAAVAAAEAAAAQLPSTPPPQAPPSPVASSPGHAGVQNSAVTCSTVTSPGTPPSPALSTPAGSSSPVVISSTPSPAAPQVPVATLQALSSHRQPATLRAWRELAPRPAASDDSADCVALDTSMESSCVGSDDMLEGRDDAKEPLGSTVPPLPRRVAPADPVAVASPLSASLLQLVHSMEKRWARCPPPSAVHDASGARFRTLLAYTSLAAFTSVSTTSLASVAVARGLPAAEDLQQAAAFARAREAAIAAVGAGAAHPPQSLVATRPVQDRWARFIAECRVRALGPLGSCTSGDAAAGQHEQDAPSTPPPAKRRVAQQLRLNQAAGLAAASAQLQSAAGACADSPATSAAASQESAALPADSSSPPRHRLEEGSTWQEGAATAASDLGTSEAWAAWCPLDVVSHSSLRDLVPDVEGQHASPLDVSSGSSTSDDFLGVVEPCPTQLMQAALRGTPLLHGVATGHLLCEAGDRGDEAAIPPASDAALLAMLSATPATAAPEAASAPRRKRGTKRRLSSTKTQLSEAAQAFQLLPTVSAATGATPAWMSIGSALRFVSHAARGCAASLRQLHLDVQRHGVLPGRGVMKSVFRVLRAAPHPTLTSAASQLVHTVSSMFPPHAVAGTTALKSAAPVVGMIMDIALPFQPHLQCPEVALLPEQAPPLPGCAPRVQVRHHARPWRCEEADVTSGFAAHLGVGNATAHKLDVLAGRLSFAAWGAGQVLRDTAARLHQAHVHAPEAVQTYNQQVSGMVAAAAAAGGEAFRGCTTGALTPPWAAASRMATLLRSADAPLWKVVSTREDQTSPRAALSTSKQAEYDVLQQQAAACLLVDACMAVFREHGEPRWVSPAGHSSRLLDRVTALSQRSMQVAGHWLAAVGQVAPLSPRFALAVAAAVRALPSPSHRAKCMAAWGVCPLRDVVQALLGCSTRRSAAVQAACVQSMGVVSDAGMQWASIVAAALKSVR